MGEVILVEEANQLFTVRQEVDAVEMKPVDDIRSKGQASSLSHDHRGACIKFGPDVNCLWWLLLETENENPKSSRPWVPIWAVRLGGSIHIAAGALEKSWCCDFVPVRRWHLLQGEPYT